MTEKVYIEGMKMPACCAECRLVNSVQTQDGTSRECIFGCYHTTWDGEKCRAIGCPLRVLKDPAEQLGKPMTSADKIRKKLNLLIRQRKATFQEDLVKFLGNANDSDDFEERLLDVACVTTLDGRDPVLDNISGTYFESDSCLIENIWAESDTIQELENLKRLLEIKHDGTRETSIPYRRKAPRLEH